MKHENPLIMKFLKHRRSLKDIKNAIKLSKTSSKFYWCIKVILKEIKVCRAVSISLAINFQAINIQKKVSRLATFSTTDDKYNISYSEHTGTHCQIDLLLIWRNIFHSFICFLLLLFLLHILLKFVFMGRITIFIFSPFCFFNLPSDAW